jgi:hypothetical protein
MIFLSVKEGISKPTRLMHVDGLMLPPEVCQISGMEGSLAHQSCTTSKDEENLVGSRYSWRIEKFHQRGLYWTENESLASMQFCLL